MLGTILIFKISHHGGLQASQFESIHQILAVQIDVSGLFKLFNLIIELNNLVAVNSSQLFPHHICESLNVTYISFQRLFFILLVR